MDAKLFDALADENRLGILRLLTAGEKCLCEVSEALGISSALASHHVKRLREAGLVKTRRQGLWLHCDLDRQKLAEVAALLTSIACDSEAPRPPSRSRRPRSRRRSAAE